MTATTGTSARELSASANQLKRNALGLPSAIAMSTAFISPTIGVIFISALIGGQAGVSSPFAFILGTLGIALMAWTLAEFAKRVTSAGGFYKFVTLAFGSQTGFVLGVLLLFAYVLQSPLNINLFGGFVGNALQAYFGFESCLTVAEEVKNPRRNLPIALIGSVVMTGLWFTFAMYAVVVGYGSSHMDTLAAASAPLPDLAVRYIGPW